MLIRVDRSRRHVPVWVCVRVVPCVASVALASTCSTPPAAQARPFVPVAAARVDASPFTSVANDDASPFAPLARAGAHSAFTSVNEYGSLELENNKGATVDERGRGWGTFACNVYIQMTLSGTLVRATYSAYPHGGSIVGTATAHIHSATTEEAEFSGTITLSDGTGSYAHPSGTASFDGKINRTSYAMNVKVAGRLRL
jgi:hypothetical protein